MSIKKQQGPSPNGDKIGASLTFLTLLFSLTAVWSFVRLVAGVDVGSSFVYLLVGLAGLYVFYGPRLADLKKLYVSVSASLKEH